MFSSIHHSCQFTGSSTHTSIYRQFHSSVCRRFNSFINLQAVPFTHPFTGNSIHTKKCMHHLHQSTGNSIHTKGPYTIHTNLQAVPYTIHTNLQVIPFTCSSILHTDLQAIPSTNLQVIPVAHNPYIQFPGTSSRHWQAVLYNLLLKIFTMYIYTYNKQQQTPDWCCAIIYSNVVNAGMTTM